LTAIAFHVFFIEGRAEENGQQQARSAKHEIPQRTPHFAVDVIAEFDRRAALPSLA
jgi:hypothetical protein